MTGRHKLEYNLSKPIGKISKKILILGVKVLLGHIHSSQSNSEAINPPSKPHIDLI